MTTLQYHLVDPKLRKQVDLRDYADELAWAVKPFPAVLDKVKRSYYQITITDSTINRIVRKLGRQIARNTSLKKYARKKSGSNPSYELFKQKKSKKSMR